MSDNDWHGWSRWDKSRTLHIGPLPGRKSICLYTDEKIEGGGSVLHVHAYFRSEEEAKKAMTTLDFLMFGPDSMSVKSRHHIVTYTSGNSYACRCEIGQDHQGRDE